MNIKGNVHHELVTEVVSRKPQDMLVLPSSGQTKEGHHQKCKGCYHTMTPGGRKV